MTRQELEKEFNRQVENLVQKGYPEASGKTSPEFVKQLEPLKVKLKELSLPPIDLEKGILPFVIVIKSELIPTEKAMALAEWEGKNGITKLFPLNPIDFTTIKGVVIPEGRAYLLVDIDRGKESLNFPPSQALEIIYKAKRSPLTIDEGVAVLTQYPQFLMKNNCFSLLASRHSGDKRVPAIWINGNKHPNLGWCWDGNPHTWLGSASCSNRL